MDESLATRALVAILRAAYSGELAAGLAYRGHWKSLRDPEQRRRIREIEDEEWHHRALVGDMLAACGAAPSRSREVVFWLIGRVLGALCHVSGWLAPMYGAGRLESRNVREYETAARRAVACGRREWVECLLTMAEVEWEHEAYFRARVQSHGLGRLLPLWTAPPPKPTIRGSFECDVRASESQAVNPPSLLRVVALFLAVLLGSAPLAHAQSARSVDEIAVSFAFPDGAVKRTTVTTDEVEKLTGQRPAYKLLPWVHAALRKLELAHKSSADEQGIALTEIGGVANGPRGRWVYSVNGVASPYRLDTQTIEDVNRIAFSYR